MQGHARDYLSLFIASAEGVVASPTRAVRARVQFERAMFHSTDDSFVCKVASTTEEATELIELVFEYVNEINGRHLYRKKK